MSSYLAPSKFFSMVSIPYENAVNEQSMMITQPKTIRKNLRLHQKACIYEMLQKELNLKKGYELDSETLFSKYAILGDPVGVGKSLMVLGYIAHLKEKPQSSITNIQTLNERSKKNIFSFTNKEVKDISSCQNLIVVPHTIYRQWEEYIKKDTTLDSIFIKTRKSLDVKDFLKKCISSDCILVSNTLLSSLLLKFNEHKIHIQRTFFDEADSIHIPCTHPFPETSFVWFISATWQNIVFENARVYVAGYTLNNLYSVVDISGGLHQIKDAGLRNTILSSIQLGRAIYLRYNCKSGNYFKDFIRNEHPLRAHVVLRSADEFIQHSISLPPLETQIIQCQPSVSQRIVQSAVNQQIQTLLDAGDIQAALSQLGVPSDSPMNLIQAVTENRMKELERMQKTYEFKSSIEYATPQAKEQALEHLRAKIKSLEDQIKTIRDRIENYNKEICAICYDEPQEPVLTPCCSRIFCASCILQSLSRIVGCPMCRSQLLPANLHSFVEKANVQKSIKGPEGPPKKIDALMKLIIENPTESFLVFSLYENPFSMMTEKLQAENITVKNLKGNKDVIANILHSFEKKQTRVLLLNADHAGAGLNITTASYVVLWHAMSLEDEKQIVGRAYRLGREKPLKLVKLLHPNE